MIDRTGVSATEDDYEKKIMKGQRQRFFSPFYT